MPRDPRTAACAVVMAVLLAATGVGAGAPTAGTADGPARAANATDATAITVTATGDAAADPDQAVVRVAATAVADDPSNATDRLSENVSRLREALLDANLTREQVRTTGFNVYQRRPDGGPVDAGPDEAVRYVAQQGFEVTLDDPDRAGEIVDVAVGNGASEVQDVSFTLSAERRAELRNEALSEAMADARSQAETVAAAEGLALVAVRSVSTGEDRFQPRGVQAATEAAATADTEIDAGPVTVTATVQVTYAATETLDAGNASA